MTDTDTTAATIGLVHGLIDSMGGFDGSVLDRYVEWRGRLDRDYADYRAAYIESRYAEVQS